MAQMNWTYYSLTGSPYMIQMYHGDDSGHLILFVNGNMILIDFNRKEPKSFNFYIENQLIEFNIKREQEAYDYEVVPQPVPNHNEPEKIFTKHFWLPLIMLIIVLNLLFIILIP